MASLPWFDSRLGLQPHDPAPGSATPSVPRIAAMPAPAGPGAPSLACYSALMSARRGGLAPGSASGSRTRGCAPFFYACEHCRRPGRVRRLTLRRLESKTIDAQTDRHLLDPDHRRRPDRDRPGLRVRLFGHAGLQGAEGGGLPDRAGQFEPGHDHDRSRPGRRHLYRADHARDRRQDHREGAPGRAAAHHGRADRAQLRAVAAQDGRARQVRRQDDRRHRRRHRQGGGPRAVPRGDGAHRPGDAALAPHQDAAGGARRARGYRPARHHPARPSRSAAPAAASPTTRPSSSRSSSAASTPRPPTRC